MLSTNTAAVNWADFDAVWTLMVQLGILLITLLVANVLRRRVPFIRRLLFPTALIAGILVFVVKTVLHLCDVNVGAVIDNATMQIITYHMLGIGFAAMALKRGRVKEKVRVGKLFEYSLLHSSVYMLQAFAGLLVTLVCFGGIFYAGILLPCGFAQGTGNAMAWGSNYTAYGLEDGAGFGLTIATVGFIVGSVFGVIYMNYMRRKGKLRVRDHGNRAQVQGEAESAESVSVDKLSINLGLVFLAYAIAYAIMVGLNALGGLFASLAWGLSFLWAQFAGMVIRLILDRLEKKKVLQKSARSNYLLDRISGFCFDLMVVAGIVAIEWETVAAYWLPLTVLCVVGTVITFLQCHFGAKFSFRGYENETFLVQFGTLTGTVNNGMILLREIDPDYTTPAANYIVTANVFNFILIAPLFLLFSVVPTGKTAAWLCCGLFFVLWAVYTLLLFRRSLFRARHPKCKDEIWTDDRGFVTEEQLLSDSAPAGGDATDGQNG